MSETIGRVLRASTTGFDCGTRGRRMEDLPQFGAFVRVGIDDAGRSQAVGLIYAIRIDDDPLARELVMASAIADTTLIDQRENRMVPVEMGVIAIGYTFDGSPTHNLPPRPPMSLTPVMLCSGQEVYDFTRELTFFRLVLNAREVPAAELLGAALAYASYAYPEDQRRAFLVRCGQQLARLLSGDLRRLTHVLEMIRPQEDRR